MFSVPHNTTPGTTHSVALEDESGRSAAMNFMVIGNPLMTAKPRVDHVMVLDTTFSDGSVSETLYVQGANFDIGAVVKVDGSEVATIAQKAILNNLYNVPQEAFKDPIHHYVSLAAVPAARPPGTQISIVVRNNDTVESLPVTYTLPASAATLDSDGDTLPDAWEVAGHDQNNDGVNDADPYRRDLFVELDVMDDLVYAIDPSSFDAVRTMFRAAPFLNPYSDNGINLMLDATGHVPSWDNVIFDTPDAEGNAPDGQSLVAFSALRAAHFDHKTLGNVYHYVIWARRQLDRGSGKSDGLGPTPDLQAGDDILISLDDLALSYQTPRSQAEILAHELGHNLGQRHGGANDEPYNPNYFSVMSYPWALRTGATDLERMFWATCLPFYYAQPSADEPGDTVPVPVNMILDFSAGMAAPVNEDALDENTGVCAQTVDWNESGHEGSSVLLMDDANENGTKHETIEDFANWRALRFDGPSKNGTLP
jgi:hypothetical protein